MFATYGQVCIFISCKMNVFLVSWKPFTVKAWIIESVSLLAGYIIGTCLNALIVFYSLFHRLSCKLALKNACTIIHLAFEQALWWGMGGGGGRDFGILVFSPLSWLTISLVSCFQSTTYCLIRCLPISKALMPQARRVQHLNKVLIVV